MQRALKTLCITLAPLGGGALLVARVVPAGPLPVGVMAAVLSIPGVWYVLRFAYDFDYERFVADAGRIGFAVSLVGFAAVHATLGVVLLAAATAFAPGLLTVGLTYAVLCWLGVVEGPKAFAALVDDSVKYALSLPSTDRVLSATGAWLFIVFAALIVFVGVPSTIEASAAAWVGTLPYAYFRARGPPQPSVPFLALGAAVHAALTALGVTILLTVSEPPAPALVTYAAWIGIVGVPVLSARLSSSIVTRISSSAPT
ncbi:hypothetical protein U3A55_11420 [Salarchaeum sp. III]|uniref:hypothetical protein n=1 Tax=Salarchaeum sp. III TaxID=3107927 RepID=UPI002ED8C717